MRERQTVVTPQLLEYLETNFTAENDFLANLVQESWEKEKIPQINITGYQANFLQFIIKTINAKNILEIGTLAGYSAITMAKAAGENAKITTVEKNEQHYNFAKSKIEQAGFEKIIEIIHCDARNFVESFCPEKSLDLIFVDADKTGYHKYFIALTPHLRKNGLFIADNALAFGYLLDSAPEKNPNAVKSILNFHKYLLSNKDFFTTLVPIGDGFLISLKLV